VNGWDASAAFYNVVFPLTPALSLRERGSFIEVSDGYGFYNLIPRGNF